MSKTSSSDTLSARRRHFRYVMRRVTFVLIVSAVLGVLIVADLMGVFGRRPSKDWNKYHGKTFRCVRVIDGDTFDVDISDGRYRQTRIRPWGMDTPETVKPNTPVQHFGTQASQFTRQLCLNKELRLELEPHKKTRDNEKYNRLLAWVYLPDGRLLNRVLVAKGYAYVDPRYENHLMKELLQLQKEARENRRGLWKDVRHKDLPYYYREGRYKITLP